MHAGQSAKYVYTTTVTQLLQVVFDSMRIIPMCLIRYEIQ